MPRQFVACQFKPGEGRAYTYHNDGEPVAPGDRVIIENRSGGQQTVHVASIWDDEPPFATKPILGLAPPLDEAAPEFELKGASNGQ
jgi:hypothetical protein